MTSAETRDLSGKADRSRVNSNTKRVGKSRHVDGGVFTTVAILNEKSFRSLIEAREFRRNGGGECAAFNNLQRSDYIHKMGWIQRNSLRIQDMDERRQPVGKQKRHGMDYEDH